MAAALGSTATAVSNRHLITITPASSTRDGKGIFATPGEARRENIVFFTDNELTFKKIIIVSGKIFLGANVNPLDTQTKKINWVLTKDGQIFANYTLLSKGISHASLWSAQEPEAIGLMTVKQGRITSIMPAHKDVYPKLSTSDKISLFMERLKKLGYEGDLKADDSPVTATPPRKLKSKFAPAAVVPAQMGNAAARSGGAAASADIMGTAPSTAPNLVGNAGTGTWAAVTVAAPGLIVVAPTPAPAPAAVNAVHAAPLPAPVPAPVNAVNQDAAPVVAPAGETPNPPQGLAKCCTIL